MYLLNGTKKMTYLDTLEKFYRDFVESTKQKPKGFVCNEKTLDKILDTVEGGLKEESKKIMKLEGVRYRGILIGVNNSVQDDIIYIQ